MLAERLKPGDEIRVIAPARSMAIIKGEQLRIAQERLNQLGFTITYGKNAELHDEFFSTSIEERIEDLHDAFTDPNVKGILTVIGGYNANQLLNYIDFEIIKNNPKILCGFSDITALQGAIYKKTGLITYSGPHFSSFGVKHGFEYTLDSFINAVTNDAPYEILASSDWSDDPWYLDQEDRHFIKNNGYTVIQEGDAEGRLIGGNLCTLNLLQGTEFMPSLKDSILFIEDDEESHALTFDRDLQSLLHLPDAQGIKGILIGRFQKNSQVTEEALRKIIESKKELHGIPVIADVNFGHVQPYATIPIGGRAAIKAKGFESEIWIEQR
ncbi:MULTISPECIES: S66 peptidase family protein [Cytobacillus]|jgi:muramoyltetrapeptide carboxypeptidase LdcA involved in peptidoglycan recycling|uniref:Peptidase S66 n=2 Tax=Cytobacillus TaxID=2675230 RepID=A0A160MDF6_9BACI|nr:MULTISPECIES: S66 peptidase family protein [Cytobacillus]MCS0827026.1 LD-carboxypeptidase [Cytobacillus firmus]AND41097.1 peptidase S66 [Cytobacillus oceanisediminis 2691]MCM3243452.1 LD-carboxypeptidase [Cytobacillus oceanisediminis]MCM3396041.1 LD-carboxypeptidase [Cytobacillus oceanisediminis]MCM3401715.1 LD-carboxypeptidase [Cytobacillus oceanisediminis]